MFITNRCKFYDKIIHSRSGIWNRYFDSTPKLLGQRPDWLTQFSKVTQAFPVTISTVETNCVDDIWLQCDNCACVCFYLLYYLGQSETELVKHFLFKPEEVKHFQATYHTRKCCGTWVCLCIVKTYKSVTSDLNHVNAKTDSMRLKNQDKKQFLHEKSVLFSLEPCFLVWLIEGWVFTAHALS